MCTYGDWERAREVGRMMRRSVLWSFIAYSVFTWLALLLLSLCSFFASFFFSCEDWLMSSQIFFSLLVELRGKCDGCRVTYYPNWKRNKEKRKTKNKLCRTLSPSFLNTLSFCYEEAFFQILIAVDSPFVLIFLFWLKITWNRILTNVMRIYDALRFKWSQEENIAKDL